MATPAQITANQINAQSSTGPRTEAGKHASSLNSTTAGLTAHHLFVRSDEQAGFDLFLSELVAEIQPEGRTQSELFHRLVHAGWNLRRCDLLESKVQQEALALGLNDALESDELTRKLDRFYRYKKMHESSHRRAFAELRRLQTEQAFRGETQELKADSILVDANKIITRLGHLNVIEQQANLNVIRQHIELCLAPPDNTLHLPTRKYDYLSPRAA